MKRPRFESGEILPDSEPEVEVTSYLEVEIERIPDRQERLQAVSERLRRTIEAAEHDLPEEARNERRHEIKDLDKAAIDELANSVGQILEQIHQKTSQQHARFQPKPRPIEPPTLPQSSPSLPPYQQTILIGIALVWLAILTALIIVKLL